MEKAPQPARPREGAKNLVRFLVTQNKLNDIASGSEKLILGAPWNDVVDALGDTPTIDDIVELLEVTLKILGEHAEQIISQEEMKRLRLPIMERIGRMIQYSLEKIADQVTVTIDHPQATASWDVSGTGKAQDSVQIPIPECKQLLTGIALQKKVVAELQTRLDKLAPETMPTYRGELVRRFTQVLKKN